MRAPSYYDEAHDAKLSLDAANAASTVEGAIAKLGRLAPTPKSKPPPFASQALPSLAESYDAQCHLFFQQYFESQPTTDELSRSVSPTPSLTRSPTPSAVMEEYTALATCSQRYGSSHRSTVFSVRKTKLQPSRISKYSNLKRINKSVSQTTLATSKKNMGRSRNQKGWKSSQPFSPHRMATRSASTSRNVFWRLDQNGRKSRIT